MIRTIARTLIASALSGFSPRRLYYWRPEVERYGIGVNFGDTLFRWIAERIAGRAIRPADVHGFAPKFLAGGSILHCARPFDTIWGVGLRDPRQTFDEGRRVPRGLDVRSVRGPITRDFLVKRCGLDVPEIYGDPALLLPTLFPELRRESVRGRIGVVPHFSDQHSFERLPPEAKLIRPDREPGEVISEILSCDFVIAGSLHGIIVAEAYGIPARWLKTSPTEPELKYFDYFQSTNRNPRPATTLDEAMSLGAEPPIADFDVAKLRAAFPSDLAFDFEKKISPSSWIRGDAGFR